MSYYVDTQITCLTALADQRARTNPAFAKAIIRSYASGKLAKGKSLIEVGWKLDLVEQEIVAMRFPDYGQQFIEVRRELNLRDSRIYPPNRSARASSSSTASAPTPRRQTVVTPPAPGRPRVGGAGVPVTRLAGTESRAEPPPAYASADPNPDADLARAIHASLVEAMEVPVIREEGVVGGGGGGVAAASATGGRGPGTGGNSPNGRSSLDIIPEPTNDSLDDFLTGSPTSPTGRRASHSDPHSPLSAVPNRNSLTATAAAPRHGTSYSAPVSARSSPPHRTSPLPPTSAEDPLALLSSFSTLLILDDSTSMASGTLWSDCASAVSSVVPLAATFDPEGVEVIFLNSKERAKCATEGDVRELFEAVGAKGGPEGATPLGTRLEEVLLDYLGRLDREREREETRREAGGGGDGGSENGGDEQRLMRLNIIVITDGASLKLTSGPRHNPFASAPTDDPESVIVSACRRLDAHHYPLNQLGIQLVQIGSDPEATAFLKELDDGLAGQYGGIRDIVDTVPWKGQAGGEGESEEGMGRLLRKILLGGVNKRIDRSG